MADTLKIYRKSSPTPTRKPSAAKAKAVAEALRVARVQRPELLDFFLSGEFHRLPAIPAAVIDNPVKRITEHGDEAWAIPEGSMGRAPKSGERDYQSTGQSILLWCKKYLCETGVVSPDEISIVVE